MRVSFLVSEAGYEHTPYRDVMGTGWVGEWARMCRGNGSVQAGVSCSGTFLYSLSSKGDQHLVVRGAHYRIPDQGLLLSSG